jgi:hypothetical protein
MPGTAFPGFPTTLANDVLLDAGALYMGAIGAGVLLGRTSGGLKFEPGRTIEDMNFDGKRAGIMGLQRITDYKSTISGKLLSYGISNTQIVEPGIVSASGSGAVSTVFSMQQASSWFAAGAYLTNVRAIFRRSDGTYVQIRFPYAICMKYSITTKDKLPAEIDFEFQALLNMSVVNPFNGNAATTDDAPYGIEYLLAGSTL